MSIRTRYTTTTSSRNGLPLWASIVAVDFLGFVFGLLPALSLGIGIQAIGAVNGWWLGDPNSNDGEEGFATVLGLLGALIVLGAMTVALTRSARRQGIRALRTITVNMVLFVAGYTALVTGLF